MKDINMAVVFFNITSQAVGTASGIKMFVIMYFVLLIGLFVQVQGFRHNCSTTPAPRDLKLENCIKESGANPSEVEWLRKGNYNKSSPMLKKWVFCYLVKNGVMSQSGVLRQHVVLKNIPEQDQDEVEVTINKCLYNQAHDPSETAWHYVTCFRTMHPKYAKEANGI